VNDKQTAQRILAALRDKRRSQGITTNELVDIIYGDDSNGGPDDAAAAIHVHIHRLNRTLRDDGLRIRTVHLYRLEPWK